MSLVSQLNLAFQRVATELNKRGLPKGGSAGQVLAKASATDFVSNWVNPGSPIGKGATTSHTGNVSLSSAVGTQVSFNSQDLNDDSTVYTLNSSGILLNTGGLFLITWSADISGSGSGNRSAYIQCSGVTRGEAVSYSAGLESRLGNSRIIRLAAGTQIALFVAIDGGGTLLGSASKDTSLTVAYLGA